MLSCILPLFLYVFIKILFIFLHSSRIQHQRFSKKLSLLSQRFDNKISYLVLFWVYFLTQSCPQPFQKQPINTKAITLSNDLWFPHPFYLLLSLQDLQCAHTYIAMMMIKRVAVVCAVTVSAITPSNFSSMSVKLIDSRPSFVNNY